MPTPADLLTRGIAPATLDALASGYFCPVVLVRLDWPEDEALVHSGLGPLSWGGRDWTGVGLAGGLTLPGDGAGVAIGRGQVSLGGTQERIHDLIESAEAAAGRVAEVWFGVVTEAAGTTLIGEPFPIFTGYMAEASESQSFDGLATRFAVEVALDSQPHPRAEATSIHNDADQRRRDPDPLWTDTGGRHLRANRARIRAMAARG